MGYVPRPGKREGGLRRGASAASERTPCAYSTPSASDSSSPAWSITESRSLRRHSCRNPASTSASSSAATRAVPVGTTRFDQTHPLRLRGVDRASGEDQVQRPAGPDQPGQPHGAPVDQRHAPATAEHAEHGIRSGHPQVAPGASSRPPATAYPSMAAITGFDSRIRVGPIGPSPSSVDPVAVLGADRLEVRTGAERAAVAVQHRDRLAVVGVERPEGVGQGVGRRPVHGVPGVCRSRITVVTAPERSERTVIEIALAARFEELAAHRHDREHLHRPRRSADRARRSSRGRCEAATVIVKPQGEAHDDHFHGLSALPTNITVEHERLARAFARPCHGARGGPSSSSIPSCPPSVTAFAPSSARRMTLAPLAVEGLALELITGTIRAARRGGLRAPDWLDEDPRRPAPTSPGIGLGARRCRASSPWRSISGGDSA